MTEALRRFGRILGQGLSLSFWRRPSSRVELVEFGIFLACCATALLVYAVHDISSTEWPAEFYGHGLYTHVSYLLFVLIAAWFAARLLQRSALWLTLASLTVLIGIPWTAISLIAMDWLGDAHDLQVYAWQVLLALAGFVAVFRAVGFIASGSPAFRRLAASLLFVLVLGFPWYWQQTAWLWYPPEEPEEVAPGPGPAKPAPALEPTYEPEAVLGRQRDLVLASVQAVRPQTPGKIDLYGVGFAGDGGEKVFRNEVEYFEQLMTKRFDAPTVPLINSPRTLDRVPLATLTNLRAALAGLGTRMDISEDVLVLFLTSHGSEDHKLFVSLKPLPLKQIRPRDLRAALDEARIKWRVVIVSACYSGGFIDALRDEQTLVITAARRDRTSFGCGSTSEITWFGKAFLAQALNQTNDFERGFELANKQIREWELAEGETASAPQMVGGWAIRRHLATWRATQAPTEPVAFAPK